MNTIGSLFSGIGGLELGLERAGLGAVAWQVEFDPFCRRILAKHWPHADRTVTDVKACTARTTPPVDIICGGFPCQDVSSAGKGAGLAVGTRSGLWFEYARIVAELRPRIVVVENVASGKSRWLPQVRRDLYLLGYDTAAYALSAADVGAPHLRRRIFVVAHPFGESLRVIAERMPWGRPCGVREQGKAVALRDGGEGRLAVAATHADVPQREGVGVPIGLQETKPGARGDDGDADRDGQSAFAEHAEVAGLRGVEGGPWARPSASLLRGVDDGLSDRVDTTRRLKGLGNAVVNQCAEVIGHIIRAGALPDPLSVLR